MVHHECVITKSLQPPNISLHLSILSIEGSRLKHYAAGLHASLYELGEHPVVITSADLCCSVFRLRNVLRRQDYICGH